LGLVDLGGIEALEPKFFAPKVDRIAIDDPQAKSISGERGDRGRQDRQSCGKRDNEYL
jgi:hypothetical protein